MVNVDDSLELNEGNFKSQVILENQVGEVRGNSSLNFKTHQLPYTILINSVMSGKE